MRANGADNQPISNDVMQLLGLMGPLLEFFTDSPYSRSAGNPRICNFVNADPRELPFPALTETLSRAVVPQEAGWLANGMNDPAAQRAVATSLSSRTGLDYRPADICLTSGAFGALASALKAILNPADEVITISPCWPFYPWLVLGAGGKPVDVPAARPGWELDVGAISAAITERTRAVIVNSPHNPTGRIYPAETLEELGRMLRDASSRHGRTIYLLSDESFSRVLFDGNRFTSPCRYYDNSFLIYTFSKVLLASGLRLGYLALNPAMESGSLVRGGVLAAQIANGWTFPNVLMQYAVPELDGLSIDVGRIQARRDRMVSALREHGYEVETPEAAMFLTVRSPWGSSAAFAELLSEYDIYVIPGSLANFEGYFRISLTATDEMVESSLPGFAAAIRVPERKLVDV
jgi:aspartate aminotransferase